MTHDGYDSRQELIVMCTGKKQRDERCSRSFKDIHGGHSHPGFLTQHPEGIGSAKISASVFAYIYSVKGFSNP